MALITTAEREALLQRAITVRDEIMLKANTANRVGSLFYDIIQMFASVDLDELRRYFLQKDVDDETQHMLTMAEAWVKGDLTFGSENPDHATAYVSGIKGCKIYWNGSGWAIETDYLSVNKRMYARSVQVDEVTHVGGENLLTDASCIANRVKEYPTFYRVFFRRKNGEGRTIYNKFCKGDQAYCQIFNIDAGLNFTNRYYWRLVLNTSNNISEFYDEETEALLDEFHFIDLSKSDCDTTGYIRMDANAGSVPQPEDPIVQLGYRRQQGDDDAWVAERQGATLISGGGRYKRAIVMWEGIDSFLLPNPRIYFSPNRVEMTVDSLKIRTSGSDKPIEQFVDDNQSQFLIFETESTDVPTLSNAPYTSWSAAEKELYSTEPNNAVILNSDGRTWRFVKTGNVYAFEEFTDPWLLAQHAKIEVLNNTIEAIVEWVGKDGTSYGASGLKVLLNNLFVGTNAINLQTDNQGNVLYFDTADRQIYDDTNGIYYLNDSTKVYYKDTDPSAVDKTPAEYGKPRVENISKSGLVTSTAFAELVASLNDGHGHLISAATIAAWISNSFDVQANANKIKSHINITADDVKIESGSRSLHDFFSLQNGNLWCQNITVEGVINNLINVIDNDSYEEKVPTGTIVSGVVNYEASEFVENAPCLDVLCLGDIIELRMDYHNSPVVSSDLYLPFMVRVADVNDDYFYKTLTRYGGDLHLITFDEVRQLIGRRITIFNNTSMGQTTFWLKTGPRLYPVGNKVADGDVQVYDVVKNGANIVEDYPLNAGAIITMELTIANVTTTTDSAHKTEYTAQCIFWRCVEYQQVGSNIADSSTFIPSVWDALTTETEEEEE